ncbi:hypothetical protein FHU29_004152 [Hoyosella altamirensis]|uniref:Uncharacterized protein n=1 Tax=Hoyosella altamirensis TaxID=616997 RepID=A0A839RUB8_9ACTN|nr:hypothetical protein [Hoyosella altamirensis]
MSVHTAKTPHCVSRLGVRPMVSEGAGIVV